MDDDWSWDVPAQSAPVKTSTSGGDDDWGTPMVTSKPTSGFADDDWGPPPAPSRGYGGADGGVARGGGSSTGCRKCGEDGHFARECPNAPAGGGGPRKCFKCQGEGHMARECPNAGQGAGGDEWSADPNNNSSNRGGNPGECFNCKQTGHISKDCPNPRIGANGKPVDNYVPEEITDAETLFNQGIATGINFSRYANVKVEVTGENLPAPINSFEASGLRDLLVQNIRRAKYTTPTPIQKYGIPIITSGRDVMACAQTGSGKTAAFVLPILDKLMAQDVPSNMGNPIQTPQVIVLTPTRELAIQIHQEFVKFAINSAIKAQLAYGGTSVRPQMERIRKGTHVLVATPGRLLMFVESGEIALEEVQFFILDEADKMLDMGFMGDIKRIGCHPTMNTEGRQTLMFSATFPQEIQLLAKQFLQPNYAFIAVGMVGCANSDVEQRIILASYPQKRDQLMALLREAKPDEKFIIFVNTKRSADVLTLLLCHDQFNATSIHGDRLQRERELAINEFKKGIRQILLATAVAARGLDIPNVAHVVNFDLPADIDEYVHRIGRTGRVGNTGKATSFYDPERDAPLAPQLVNILSQAQQEVPDFLQEAVQYAGGYGESAAGGSMFGGRDIRNLGSGGRGGFPPGIPVDDGWGSASAGAPAVAADPADEWY